MSNVNENRRLAEIESGQAELRNSERQANFAAGQIELFRLAEDVEGNGPAYAQRIDYMGQEAGTSLTQVYGHSNHLDGVRAGVAIPFARIAGKWIGLTFGCQQDCPHSGEINLGVVPIGQVGEEFTHEISLSNIANNEVTVEGLPAGMSFDAGTRIVSGTPAEFGVFMATVTGQGLAANNTTCTVTKILRIRVRREMEVG